MTDVCASCGSPAAVMHNGRPLCGSCYESAVPSWLRDDGADREEIEEYRPEVTAPEGAEAPVEAAAPALDEPADELPGMTEAEFEALVVSLQERAVADPVGYRLRVLLLALLGYGFLVGAVVVLGTLSIIIVIILVALRVAFFGRALAGPLWNRMEMVIRALWVRIPKPTGLPLTAARAPALFALIEDVRRDAQGPRIHDVLVDGNFNAGIVQVPRLGAFGWQRNYLVLGLPLLQLLPTEEFKAVLAHEIGHLVGAHGTFGTWVYRQRQSWLSLLQRLEAEKKLEGSVFLSFSRWYAPLFNAHTFVMARAHEYDADQLSARVTSPAVAADALSRLEIGSRWLGKEFWPKTALRCRESPLPPRDIMGELVLLGRTLDAETVAARLAEGTAAVTHITDTHPSYSQRLAALGATPRAPAGFKVSAAEELMGALIPELAAALNKQWYDFIEEHWKRDHVEAGRQRARLAELEAKESTEPLPVKERWERACLLRAEGRAQESEAIVEELIAAAPDYLPAQGAWGMVLLGRGDEAGLAYVDRALSRGADPASLCESAYAYLRERNRPAEAERYAVRLRRHQKKMAAAEAERSTFEIGDLLGHGLAEATLQPLREGLAEIPRVRAAYLTRKRLKHFPESPLFIMCVDLSGSSASYSEEVGKVVARLSLPGNWYCVPLASTPRAFRNRFKKVSGGAFYQAT